jgi:hypothetical protein
MKKRIPTLVLFGVVLLVFSILLGWKSCAGNKNNPDRDYDGVLNIKDSCPDEYAKTTNGCPVETKSQLGTDKDKDGRYAEFQKDTALFDPNDNNACIPNHTCDYCDQDGDGLTYPQEIAKKTEPTKPDTDGDGLNDKMDRCPLEYGVNLSKGCPINISVNLRKPKNEKKLVWNSELNEHELETYLYITCLETGLSEPVVNVTNRSNYVLPKLRTEYDYMASLKITLKQPKAVKISNTTTRW